MSQKNKRIMQGILFVAIIIGFIYIGTRDFDKKRVVDHERFDLEYKNVSKDNVFKYVNAQEVYTSLKKGKAIIFMGFPSNKWTGYYAAILNTAAKEAGIKEILYYDFKEDRDQKNATYQSIVLKLIDFASILDDGKPNFYAPTLIIVENGSVLAFDNETAIKQGNISPEKYWNEIRKNAKLQELKIMFQEYTKGSK